MGHEQGSASEGFLRLGHVCSWLTHVLSLPDNEGYAAFALASAASAGRDVKSKTPSEMVLVFLFCFVCLCRGAVLLSSDSGSRRCDAQDAAAALQGASAQSAATFVS